jgi:tetratricopeptide (TPR) repeat protein
LLPLILIGLALVGAAWWLRSSPYLREPILRGKDLPELEALVQSAPGDALARYHLAKRYYLERRFDEAVTAYEAAVRLEPKAARAYLGLALARYEQGQTEAARRAFQQALERDPRSAWAEYMLGKIAWQKGDLEQALPHVRRATELDPRSDQAWYGLGVCYTHLRRPNEAVAALRQAVAAARTSAKYHTALGELLVQGGHTGRRDDATTSAPSNSIRSMARPARFWATFTCANRPVRIAGSRRRAADCGQPNCRRRAPPRSGSTWANSASKKGSISRPCKH